MKQETLYDAFLNCLINKEFKNKEDYIAFKGAEFGAKWQQERSYSEEEFKEVVYHMVGGLAQANNMTFNGAILDELFNKFKKK